MSQAARKIVELESLQGLSVECIATITVQDPCGAEGRLAGCSPWGTVSPRMTTGSSGGFSLADVPSSSLTSARTTTDDYSLATEASGWSTARSVTGQLAGREGSYKSQEDVAGAGVLDDMLDVCLASGHVEELQGCVLSTAVAGPPSKAPDTSLPKEQAPDQVPDRTSAQTTNGDAQPSSAATADEPAPAATPAQQLAPATAAGDAQPTPSTSTPSADAHAFMDEASRILLKHGYAWNQVPSMLLHCVQVAFDPELMAQRQLEELLQLTQTHKEEISLRHNAQRCEPVVRHLGSGSFGSVFQSDATPGVVFKLVSAANAIGQGADEAAYGLALDHLNVMPILGMSVCCGRDVLPRSLHQRFPELLGPCVRIDMQAADYDMAVAVRERKQHCGFGGTLSVREVLMRWRGLLEGLRYLHAGQTMHCDLKLLNTLLVDGVPKISDFGHTRSSKLRPTFDPRVDTWEYYPPEAFSPVIPAFAPYAKAGETLGLSDKSDVFMAGLLLLEMLSGQQGLYFALPSSTTMMCEPQWQGLNMVRAQLSHLLRHVHPAVQDLVWTTTSNSAVSRPDVEQVLESLDVVLAQPHLLHVDMSALMGSESVSEDEDESEEDADGDDSSTHSAVDGSRSTGSTASSRTSAEPSARFSRPPDSDGEEDEVDPPTSGELTDDNCSEEEDDPVAARLREQLLTMRRTKAILRAEAADVAVVAEREVIADGPTSSSNPAPVQRHVVAHAPRDGAAAQLPSDDTGNEYSKACCSSRRTSESWLMEGLHQGRLYGLREPLAVEAAARGPVVGCSGICNEARHDGAGYANEHAVLRHHTPTRMTQDGADRQSLYGYSINEEDNASASATGASGSCFMDMLHQGRLYGLREPWAAVAAARGAVVGYSGSCDEPRQGCRSVYGELYDSMGDGMEALLEAKGFELANLLEDDVDETAHRAGPPDASATAAVSTLAAAPADIQRPSTGAKTSGQVGKKSVSPRDSSTRDGGPKPTKPTSCQRRQPLRLTRCNARPPFRL